MSTVSSTTSSPVYYLDSETTKKEDTKSATQTTEDRFLKLLVTQMKNQDPLNPLDNAQVTSQMAQLSTVSGIEKLNATLEAMAMGYMANQSAGMIGHGVLVPGSDLAMKSSMGGGGFELVSAADKVTIKIKDSTGSVVRTLELEDQKAGVGNFTWDGKDGDGVALADGMYSFSVSALNDGQKVTADTLALGLVESVSLNGANAALLNVSNLGAFEVSKVKQIF